MPLAPIARLYAQLAGMVEGKLWLRVVIGMFLGMALGALLAPAAGLIAAPLARVLTSWIALPGDLFIRLVQMIMIPLVVASIIQGIAGEGENDRLARMGTRVALYFVGTTLVAIAIGVGAALLVVPGRGGALVNALERPSTPEVPPEAVDLPSRISGLLPTNPLASMLAGEMLSIVIFAVIVGAALASMARDRSEPVLGLVFSIQEICMTVTRWAMRIAPLAVFGLMTRTTASSGLSVLAGLGLYVLTVLAALVVVLLLYTAVVAFVTKVGVGRFFRESKDVLLLAFSVASSAAVMPLTMKTAEERLGVSRSVARFVVPVGAIMNMNGTAAYQAVATVFLAQSYGVELGIPTLALIVVTTVAASIGTPSAPGAGIIVLATVLTTVGIPASGIALIIGVDHVLGMCRTTVNVAGDLTACLVFSAGTETAPNPSEDPSASSSIAG